MKRKSNNVQPAKLFKIIKTDPPRCHFKHDQALNIKRDQLQLKPVQDPMAHIYIYISAKYGIIKRDTKVVLAHLVPPATPWSRWDWLAEKTYDNARPGSAIKNKHFEFLTESNNQNDRIPSDKFRYKKTSLGNYELQRVYIFHVRKCMMCFQYGYISQKTYSSRIGKFPLPWILWMPRDHYLGQGNAPSVAI